jgi:hypothetical protein
VRGIALSILVLAFSLDPFPSEMEQSVLVYIFEAAIFCILCGI